MKNNFTLRSAFSTEWLKIKGLGLLIIAITFGVLIPLLLFIVKIFSENARQYDGLLIKSSTNDIVNVVGPFGGFFMLLFIIIAASRISQIDHKNNGWTFLETQPISKLNIYSAKFLVLTVLSFIMFVVYFLSTILFSNLIQVIYPQEGLQFGIDFYFQFHTFVRLFVMSLGLISFQLMLSVLISGFIWSFVIGFLGFVINMVGAIRQETYDFIPYNNAATGLVFKDSSTLNHFFNYTEYLSLFWAVLFFLIGYFWYSRRGFKSAFLKNRKTTIYSILGILVFSGIYLFTTKPIYPQKSETNSMISGTIQSPKPIKNITITTRELGDKIATIPVENGKFNWQTKENIPFAEYVLDFNGKKYVFIFSKGDQMYFDIKTDDKNSKISLKGTRKAGDQFMKSDAIFSKFYGYTVGQKQLINEPLQFYKEAQKEWKDEMKELDNYRTKENIYFGNDFKDYQKQIKATKMLSAVYDYQKMTSFSDPKFSPPKDFVTNLNYIIKKPTPLLYSTQIYKEYKLKEMLPKDGTKNPDSILFVKISQMPASLEKDQLLSAQILKSINLENNEAKRNSFFAQKVTGIQNLQYKNYLQKQLQIINNQQKGKPFPDFHFQDVSGKAMSLSQFKGKYVVIDFWATWCAPCRETSPVFEYQAKKHQYNDKIVFLSASIDEDRSKWKLSQKNTKSIVTQWWISDSNVLKTLGVESIPRFMMIDPNGKIYNANMPRPNETNFGDIIEKLDENSFSY